MEDSRKRDGVPKEKDRALDRILGMKWDLSVGVRVRDRSENTGTVKGCTVSVKNVLNGKS
jgi:hypothetical protein